jgi:hypothetical protein
MKGQPVAVMHAVKEDLAVVETHTATTARPTSSNLEKELSAQIGKLAPTAFNQYGSDFWIGQFCSSTSSESAATSATR